MPFVRDTLVIRGVFPDDTNASDVILRNGKIVSVEKTNPRRAPDWGSGSSIIGPTLFDIQINGGGGYNLQGTDVTLDTVWGLHNWLAENGVSHWIPTLITSSIDRMEHGCRALANALKDATLSRFIPGIHLEGPFISAVDGPRGAHPKEHVRPPNLRDFDRLVRAADGAVSYTTVAPETEGAIPFIRAVVKRGIRVSLGHHQATAEHIARAVDAGASMCTHLGNGLSSMINRHHNPLWPQLAEDRLSASLIADLHHLPGPALKTFVRVKGPDRIILTSDCVHVAGFKPGVYELGGLPIELTRSGRINLKGTELLAGSALRLLQGVVNTTQTTDLTLSQALASASTVPGRMFKVQNAFGRPSRGRKANLVLFDIAKHKARIQAVFVDGIKVT